MDLQARYFKDMMRKASHLDQFKKLKSNVDELDQMAEVYEVYAFAFSWVFCFNIYLLFR